MQWSWEMESIAGPVKRTHTLTQRTDGKWGWFKKPTMCFSSNLFAFQTSENKKESQAASLPNVSQSVFPLQMAEALRVHSS